MIALKYICLQLGPDYEDNKAVIYHPTCKEECPNLCTNEWEYSNQNGWHVDHSIKISRGKIVEVYINLFR